MSKKESNSLSMLKDTVYEGREIYQKNTFLNAQKGFASRDEENPLHAVCRTMSIHEGRLFYLTLLEMRPQLQFQKEHGKDTPFEMMTIPTSTMLKIFGGNDGYRPVLEKAAARLYRLSINLSTVGKNGDNVFHWKRVFDEMKFGAIHGGFQFRFAEGMREYLYDMDKNYTKIEGDTIFSLCSVPAMRLVELMLEYKNMPFNTKNSIKRDFDYDTILTCFGITPDLNNAEPRRFRQNILKLAINEIHANTEYKIECIPLKAGKKVTGYQFIMHIPEEKVKKDKLAAICENNRFLPVDHEDISELLRSCGLGKIVTKNIVKEYDEDYIRANIAYSMEQYATDRIKDITAYIRAALKGNYAGYTSKAKVEMTEDSTEKVNEYTDTNVLCALDDLDMIPMSRRNDVFIMPYCGTCEKFTDFYGKNVMWDENRSRWRTFG